MHRLGGFLAVAAAAGVLWWLLSEPQGTGSPPSGATELDASGGEVGLLGAPNARSGRKEEDAVPFDGVVDPKDLLPFLGSHTTFEEAGARLRVLLADDAQRIRAFLRLLHPDAGPSAFANYMVRRTVGDALAAAGDTALDVLLSELDDGNATYRTYLDAFIGRFGTAAGRAVPRLLAQLDSVPEDPPAGEAASVINALGAIGPAAAAVLPDLYRWLQEGVTQDVEVAAAGAMVRIGGATDATWDCCRELLREVNWPRQRKAAMYARAGMGAQAAPMIPVLLDLVQEGVLGDSIVQYAIREMGVADQRVIDYLKAGFREAEGLESALGQYGQTLVRLGPPYVELALELAAERGVRARAYMPLLFNNEESPPWERIQKEMEPAFSAQEPVPRREAYIQLFNHEALPQDLRAYYVLRGLKDEDEKVRASCAWAAAELTAVSQDLAAALRQRIEAKEELLDTGRACLHALAQHERWRDERLWQAAKRLHARHPGDWSVLYQLHHFAAQHPREVLGMLADGVAQGQITWRHFLHVLGQVPTQVLSAYPAAERALAAGRKR